MPKINIPIELTNDIFDDASVQLLKSKIRSIVASEIDGRVKKVIDEAVKRQIDRVVSELHQSYNYYGAVELRKQMKEKIINTAANKYVDEDLLARSVNDLLRPVVKLAKEKTDEITKLVQGFDEEISQQVKSRVDGLFNSDLAAALANVISGKSKEDDKNV